jgi:hypothetical protein
VGRKSKKSSPLPDEVLRRGPLVFAKFGNKVIARNESTAEQHKQHLQQSAASLPSIVANIETSVRRIVDLVHQHDPLDLLRCAYWMLAAVAIAKKTEAEWNRDENSTLWTLDYIQSVVASAEPRPGPKQKVEEASYDLIRKEVSNLYGAITLPYQIASSAKRAIDGPHWSQGFEELFVYCQMNWCAVHQNRYQNHDVPYLRQFLSPHNAIFKELFDITADEFMDEISKIQKSLTFGIGEALKDLETVRKHTAGHLGPRTEETSAEKLREVVGELGLDELMSRAISRVGGDGLFELGAITAIPAKMLDVLSWSLGEDTEFFAPGEYAGWPLRITPTKKRPFLKIDGRYYCHNLSTLVDCLYRVVQKAISQTKPEYRQVWNDRQKESSEKFPLDLLSRILPGARVLSSVRYQWPPTASKDQNWCEADGLIIYDDFVIVLEMKAGSFTYTSPADDFDAFVSSLRSLVLKPLDQAKRLMEYLSSADEVALYREDTPNVYSEVAHFSARNFRHVVSLGITLDSFTHLATRASSLQSLGIDVGKTPFISISAEDLMVWADIFDSPLKFLHFIEQRIAAACNSRFTVFDEVDHLGMYLQHNQYSTLVKDFPDPSVKLQWTGYSSSVDRYFHMLMLDPGSASKPSQRIPARIQEIIRVLGATSHPGRCRIASYLLDFAEDGRQLLVEAIDQLLTAEATGARPRSVSVMGEAGLTIFCSGAKWNWSAHEVGWQTAQSMLIAGRDSRLALVLEYTPASELISAGGRLVKLSDFNEAERLTLRREADELKQRRVATARDNRKVGRNEKCPCGSGLKFKRCCGE